MMFLFALTLLCVQVCVSQSTVKHTLTSAEEIKKFGQEYAKLFHESQDCYHSKQYDAAIRSMDKIVAMFDTVEIDSQWTDIIEDMESARVDVYYTIACCHSLLKQKKQALEYLEKAVSAGYTNYTNMLEDEDLDNIRKEKKFISLLDELKAYEPLTLLKNSSKYVKNGNDSLPEFVYQDAEDNCLQNVRTYFNLDSVAGDGDEISKILNILHFVHNAIKHSGSNFALCEFDAIDIYNYYKTTGKGVNCRHLAIALNEMYLSMGIPSRYVTCLPFDRNDPDCHVINAVWSSQYQKWIWIDPTFEAYVKDESGSFLSIAEVRERLIDGRPLFLNEDANWNNQNKQTKEYYLETYMAKNLYWFDCATNFRFNPESRYRYSGTEYISLTPSEYVIAKSSSAITHDPDFFWQSPSEIGKK